MKVLIAGDDSDRSVAMARRVHEMLGDEPDYYVLTVASEDETRTVSGLRAALPPTALGSLAAAPAAVVGAVTTNPDVAAHQNPIDVGEQRAGNLAASAGIPGAHVIGDVGKPRTAIKHAARDHEIDLVVLCHRHRKWVTRWFGTSVADDVLASGATPVLLMP